jgi:hypothetical protein
MIPQSIGKLNPIFARCPARLPQIAPARRRRVLHDNVERLSRLSQIAGTVVSGGHGGG